MSNCYLCGKEKHTYDCPKYQVPSIPITTVSSTSIVKNTCSYLSDDGLIAYFQRDTSIWKMTKMIKGMIFPSWAKRGWYLDNGDQTISCSTSHLKELADHWSDTTIIPWPLGEKNYRPGIGYEGRSALLVFDEYQNKGNV